MVKDDALLEKEQLEKNEELNPSLKPEVKHKAKTRSAPKDKAGSIDDIKIESEKETKLDKVTNNTTKESEISVKNEEDLASDLETSAELNLNPEDEHQTDFNIIHKGHTSALQIILIVFSIILTIVLVSFISFTLINANSNTIISGVSIQHFDVSKLEKQEALNLINDNISKNIPEEIKLQYKDFETSIPTADLNISFDIPSSINQAYSVGRNGNLLENDIMILQTLFSNVNFEPTFTFNEEILKTKLEDISSKLPDRLIESSYYIEDSQLILTKGKSGSIVDVDRTVDLIKKCIQNLSLQNSIEISTVQKSPTPLDIDKIHSELYVEPKDAYFTQNPYSIYPSENGIDFAISVDEVKNMLLEEKDEYEIPLQILVPNVTTNMLGREAFPDLLSSYYTNYSTRDRDRTTNLILASNKINGIVLMPGEIFSYNKVVGERTIAAGYREAPIYVSGKVVDGVGGGICQITTTLYNAVVYANLEIVERSNHQFVPSYARASRDATVVYGAIDFKFKNNRNYPIKIACNVANGTANFQIYGLKTDNDYQVEISDRVTKTTSNAIYSEAYKILKQNGRVVGSYLLSRDTYKRH